MHYNEFSSPGNMWLNISKGGAPLKEVAHMYCIKLVPQDSGTSVPQTFAFIGNTSKSSSYPKFISPLPQLCQRIAEQCSGCRSQLGFSQLRLEERLSEYPALQLLALNKGHPVQGATNNHGDREPGWISQAAQLQWVQWLICALQQTKPQRREWLLILLSHRGCQPKLRKFNRSLKATAYNPGYYDKTKYPELKMVMVQELSGWFSLALGATHPTGEEEPQLGEAGAAQQSMASHELKPGGFMRPSSLDLDRASPQQQPRDTSQAQLAGFMSCLEYICDLFIHVKNICQGLLMRTTCNVW